MADTNAKKATLNENQAPKAVESAAMQNAETAPGEAELNAKSVNSAIDRTLTDTDVNGRSEIPELPHENLGDRGATAQHMETKRRGVNQRVTNAQAERIAQHMSDEVKGTVMSILKGQYSREDLPSLDAISADKKISRSFIRTVGEVMVVGLEPSVKLQKKLRAKLKRCKSPAKLMDLIENYKGDDKTEVERLFVDAVMAFYVGVGFLDADKMSKLLDDKTVKIGAAEVKVGAEVEGLLGSFPPNTDNPGGSVILQSVVELQRQDSVAPEDERILGKIFEAMRKGKPVNADVTKQDPVAKETLAEITAFREKAEKALGVLNDSEIERESGEQLLVPVRRALAEKEATVDADRSNVASLEVRSTDLRRQIRMMNPDNYASGSTERREANDRRNALSEELTGVDKDLTESKQSLRAKLESIEKDRATIIDKSSSSKDQIVALKKSQASLINVVTTFVAHTDRRLRQMAGANEVVDIAQFQKLKALKDAIAAMPTSNRADQASYLQGALGGVDNLLGLVQELSGFADVVSEKRVYTEEEFAIAFLTEKYKLQHGYNKQTAERAAIIEFTRREREARMAQFHEKAHEAKQEKMDGFFSRKYKTLRGQAEYRSAEELILLNSRIIDDEQVGQDFLEKLAGMTSYPAVRRHLLEGKVSRDAATQFMYELMSMIGGRKVDDGTFVLPKTAKDIAKIENLVNNINKFLAEDTALKVVENSNALSKTKEHAALSRPELIAVALKSYNDEMVDREVELVARSLTTDSGILSKGKIKAAIDEILTAAEADGISKAEFLAELERHNIHGLHTGLAINKLRYNQAKRAASNVVTPALNAVKTGITKTAQGIGRIPRKIYESRGKIARGIYKAATFPFRAPFMLGGAVLSGINNGVGKVSDWVSRLFIKLAIIPGTVVAGVAGAATLPLTVSVQAAKNSAAAGQAYRDALLQNQREQSAKRFKDWQDSQNKSSGESTSDKAAEAA